MSAALLASLEKFKEHLIKKEQDVAKIAVEMAIEEIHQLNAKIEKLQKKLTRLEDKITHLEKEQV